MNHAINVLSFPIFLIYAFMVTVISYDLSISIWSFRGMPYKFEMMTGFALLILLLGTVRILRRWQGIRDIKRFSKFTFSGFVAKPAMQYARLFTIIEIIFLIMGTVFCLTLLDLDPEYAWPMLVVLAALTLEMLLFLLTIKQDSTSFKIGLNDKVLAYFNREMHLYFYTGLERAELHSDEIISFKYKEDLNLTFPTNILKKEDRIPFRNALIKVLEAKNVYIDDALRNWE